MPWEQLPKVWKTKAEYFNWLRGQMRKAWSRHPIKNEFKRKMRVKAPMGKLIDKKTGLPKIVACQVCVQCGETYREGDTQVDHINPAGAFQNWEDCQTWLMGLMQVNFSSLQMMCIECHATKSYADQYGYSYEEAEAQKAWIAWDKETEIAEQKDLLTMEGATSVQNATVRRSEFVRLYLSNT